MLLFGLFAKRPKLQALGALLALGIISGAIVFHLFTPLGINVQGDGGLIFAMAVGVWIAAALIVLMHWQREGDLKP